MPSLARLHKDKTGKKFNSIVSSLGFPFRSLRKSINVSTRAGSRDSSLAAYPKKNPYTYMEDDSILESQSHEMDHVENESATASERLGQSLSQDQNQNSVNVGQNETWGKFRT
jgi:hypothetical protein